MNELSPPEKNGDDSFVGPGLRSRDFYRYLRAKNFSTRCPCCKNDSWQIIEASQHKNYALTAFAAKAHDSEEVPMQIAGFGPTSFAPVILVACDSCGYVLTFLTAYVKKWIADNQNEQS